MLKTLNTNISTLSCLLLISLKNADTHALRTTNNESIQTRTYLNSTANPCQTLNRTYTTPTVITLPNHYETLQVYLHRLQLQVYIK